MKKTALLLIATLLPAILVGGFIVFSPDTGITQEPPPPPPPPPPTIGDGYLLKRSQDETCHACHKTSVNTLSTSAEWDNAIKMHSAETLGSCAPAATHGIYKTRTECLANGGTWTPGKRSAQGGWGVPGGMYGVFVCTTCHTAHGTKNIYLIKETITTPDGSNFDGRATNSVSVDFREKAASPPPPDSDIPGRMGRASETRTASSRVCEVCHTHSTGSGGVKYHGYATNPGVAHMAASACTDCHSHKAAFSGAGGCNACHGNPPIVNTATAPDGLAWSNTTGSTTAGTHSFHATGAGRNYPCTTCHYNSAGSGNTHNNNVITMGFYAELNSIYQGGAYDGQTAVTDGYDVPSPNTSPATTVTKTNLKRCSTVYCHGGTLGSGGTQWAQWDSASSAECGTCHGATAASPPTRASHPKHASSAAGGMQLACTVCHFGYTPSIIPSGMATHVDGSASWAFDTTNYAWLSGAQYRAAATGSVTPVPSGSYGSCSSLYCHSNAQGAGGSGAPSSYATVLWGGSVTCSSCHADMTTSGTGTHIQHTNTAPYAYACSTCHNNRGADTVFHANYSIDLGFNAPNPYGATAAYSQGLSHAPGNAYGSCSSLYCHSIVQTATGEGQPLTGAAGEYKTVTWGAPVGCDACHGGAAAGTGRPASGSHAKHGETCSNCHTSNTASTHVNAVINLSLTSPGSYSLGATQTPGNNAYGTCSSTACHTDGRSIWTGGSPSGTSPKWGVTGAGCSACHGNTNYAVGDYRRAAPLYASTTGGSGKPNAHDPHMDNRAAPSGETRCRHCHYTTTTDDVTAISPPHANNLYTVSGGVAPATYPTGENVSVSAAVTMTYTYAGTPGISSCSSVSCHPTGIVTAANASLTIPWDDLSAASYQCTDCHRINMTGATTYHHSMNSETYTPNAATGYPTTVPQGHWSTGTNPTSRTCLMCHVKHNIFSDRMNTDANLTQPRAMNMRTAIGTTPTVSSGYTNTDYIAGAGGICISCHNAILLKDTARQLPESGSTQTPAIVVADYAASAHQYNVALTTKTGTQTFNANCSKCHDARNGETAQFYTGTNLGTHDSTVRRLVASLGITTPTDPLEQNFCYRCHSSNTDLGNPGGGPAKPTANMDYYGVQAMSATTGSQLIYRDISAARGRSTGGNTTTTLNDTTRGVSTTAWTASQWIGYSVRITSGTGSGQSRRITANTTTQLTVIAAWTTTPDATSVYEIGGMHDMTLASGLHKPIEGTTSGWMPSTSRHAECEDCHNPHGAKKGLSTTSGTATGGSTTTLADTGKSWPTDMRKHYRIAITGGTGAGQERYIAGNTSTTITIVGSWSTAPASGSVYKIISSAFADGGSATGGTTTTLADASRAWTAGMWVGYYVQTVSGTGARQVRLITANDAASLTVATWTAPASGTGYYIYKPPPIAGVNMGIPNVVAPVVNTDGTMRGTTYSAKASSAATQYELCLKCHSIFAYTAEGSAPNVPSKYPSTPVDTWNTTAVQTDIGRDFDPDNFAHHALFAPGKHQPLRMGNAEGSGIGQQISFNPNWPFYNAGTVSVTSGSPTVTGSATTFPVGAGAGYWIHISSGTGAYTPTNPTTTGIGGGGYGWWPVASRDSATALTLAVPYTGPTATGRTYRLTKGFKSNFVDGWGPESLTTCTDCHNTSDNTGTVTVAKARGPHGSASRWLLRNAEPQTVTELSGSVTAVAVLNTSNFCLNCHSRLTYADAPIAGSYTAPSPLYTNYGRLNHADANSCYGNSASNRTFYSIPCMNCHGGQGATVGTAGPGQIHGSNLGVGALGTTERGRRFMNGSSWNGHTIVPTTADNTCYTIGTANSLSGCTQHSGGRTFTPTYAY